MSIKWSCSLFFYLKFVYDYAYFKVSSECIECNDIFFLYFWPLPFWYLPSPASSLLYLLFPTYLPSPSSTNYLPASQTNPTFFGIWNSNFNLVFYPAWLNNGLFLSITIGLDKLIDFYMWGGVVMVAFVKVFVGIWRGRVRSYGGLGSSLGWVVHELLRMGRHRN